MESALIVEALVMCYASYVLCNESPGVGSFQSVCFGRRGGEGVCVSVAEVVCPQVSLGSKLAMSTQVGSVKAYVFAAGRPRCARSPGREVDTCVAGAGCYRSRLQGAPPEAASWGRCTKFPQVISARSPGPAVLDAAAFCGR